MLKSWSEAGLIEYVHFDYPLLPEEFAFGDTPLSDIVRETLGGSSVLFNWNTSGSAATVDFPELTVLTATRTGALPVTYGSDRLEGEAIETGHLVEYEKNAYDYFASLRDPNLARVVQYTLIYQMARAISSSAGKPALAPSPIRSTRWQSSEFLVDETMRLLERLDHQDAIRGKLAALSEEYPAFDRRQLARMLRAWSGRSGKTLYGQPDLTKTLQELAEALGVRGQ